MAHEGDFGAFAQGEAEVLEELVAAGGVLERDVAELDVALDARLEQFGVLSDLDLVFVFRVND